MVFTDESGGVYGQYCSTVHNDAGLTPAKVPQRVLVKYCPPKAGVTGSNLVGRAIFFKRLSSISSAESVGGAHLVPKSCPSLTLNTRFERLLARIDNRHTQADRN